MNIINKDLYKKVKEEADKIYKRPTSAYKSMWISKRYQELGGAYKGKKQSLTNRWLKEKWVQVIPYLTKNEIIECGADNKQNKVCRPMIRINKQTPMTLPELMKLHSKEDLLKLARKKNRDMEGRAMWKQMKFIPSKKNIK
jgi:hypothetical protein